MQIGILVFSAQRDDLTSGAERLRVAAAEAGHTATVLYEPSVHAHSHDGNVEIFYDGAPLAKFDVIICRPNYIEEPSLHSHLVSLLRRAGYLIVNGEGIAISKNKIAQHEIFSEHKLALPRWGVAHNVSGSLHVAQHIGFPVILKVPFGTWGAGVFFVPQLEVLQTVSHYLSVRDGNPMLIEEFIEEAERSDIRVFVVGGKVVASMKRTARANDVRSNASIGGTGTTVTLTTEEEQLAVRATEITGLEIAGVDIIRSKRGPLILEINSNPGFKEIEKVSGVDIAGAMIAYATARVGLTIGVK